MGATLMSKHDCPTCKCEEQNKPHIHMFGELPSYTLRTNSTIEKVWVCINKDGSYCYEAKRELKNV